jgi:hypothetical protein
MPLYNPQPDDEVVIDGSVPINGINNSLPPSAIDRTYAQDAENRLSQLDGLNRPRPGIVRLKQTAPTGSLDSINHLGTGVFLANDAANWYKYDNRSVVLSSLTGGPAFPPGAQVYSALANDTLYFSIGTALSKYSVANGFGTVPLPANGPTALYPIWAVYRLIYAYQNTLIISDELAPETFDVATGSLTLDPLTSDQVTGQALWQTQQIVVFRNGSTWMVQTGPGLAVPDWELNRLSATIGCRCHGTIVQTETDVIFLSETGRGVYKVSQAAGSDQQGVWRPVSLDIQGYINRINWAACDCARATYWNDLYMLSVPLDGFTYNNFCLIYSVSLDRWQGLWCFDIGNNDVAVRDFARDRTDPNYTVLLVATREGIISRFSYPVERQYYDRNIDGTHQLYNSSLQSRSFTNQSLRTETYTVGEDITQVRPHSVRFQFMESEDPVDVTVLANRTSELTRRSVDTTNYLLTLTIPGFPFDLDVEGYKNVTLGLLGLGICSEFQFLFAGSGNWTLYQIKTAVFPSMPLIAT